MSRWGDYFDIRKDPRIRAQGAGDGQQEKSLPWFPQWVALFLGIVVQPFLSAYLKTGHWEFGTALSWFFAAFLLAFICFPAVYRQSFDVSKPITVQIIPLFTAGLGWNSLFTTAVAFATRSHG